MSDYTPTTDEVREDFAYPWEAHKQDRPARLAAFDRWLAQHDAKVRTATLNAAADAVPPSTMPLGGELAISEPVRMRFQQWLRAQAGGAG